MYWCDSSGVIELSITKKQAMIGSHSGQCDNDIKYLCTIPAIRRQLNKINPVKLRDCLREYGAWDDWELADHADNPERILWIACSDILDNLK